MIEKLTQNVECIVIMWAIMIGVVLIDLWTGVDKAKSRHEPIHSGGLRRTINKVGEYWRVLVMFLFIDIIGALLPWYALPYASMLCTLSIILIEIKSVIENLKAKKSPASEIPKMVEEIVSSGKIEELKKILNK